jgi:hypothetical protein
VGESIRERFRQNNTTDLPVITLLRYEWGGSPPAQTVTIHFYAEPATSIDIGHVNRAFCKSKELFSDPQKFDLQMENSSTVAPPDGKAKLKQWDLTPEDELGLAERKRASNGNKRAVNPANCLQFAVV